MKGIVLFCLLFLITACFADAQNVFNPQDPIVDYNKNASLGSASRPNPDVPGLQKWVRTPVNGVTIGTDTFDNRSFKAYFINLNGAYMAFRLKFPYSYNNPDSANKKYPIDLFLHGGGEVGCATNGGIYNNERPIWLGGELFRDRVNKNQFDGFLLYPQYVVSDGCFAGWGSAPSQNFLAILAIVDSMVKYVRADNDRLLITGLSGGGYGAWRMVADYPQRVAKIMPSASAGSVANRAKFIHIPIWFATGGKDVDPSPATAEYDYQKLKDDGAEVRYTQFPTKGHAVWYDHWREPDFVAEMNNVHKANPLVFFQHNEFCREQDVDAKLGLTAGFYAYEWQRNGVTIATSVNGTKTVLDAEAVSNYTGNELNVKKFGTYRARFKRTSGSQWSAWSMRPAVIKSKTTTETLPITVQGRHSRVLPALDGSTTVPLTMANGFLHYQWYRSNDEYTLLDSNQVYQAAVGEYKGRYEEQFGCGADFSPVFKVVDANGSPKPAAATNLTAVPASQSSVKLNWTQGAGETGFEVYRSTTAGGPYQFDTLLAANAKTYEDTGLVKNTIYYYRVRAVSETGAAEASNESSARTLIDNEPPTAPSGLAYTVSTPTAVRLTWTLSTDNEKVVRYDIYVNGKKSYTAFESGFIVSHLDQKIPYTFVVVAVDAAGNESEPSNQKTYLPEGVSAGYIPGVPTDPTAEAIAYDKIKVDWTDTAAHETGYEVVRSTSATGTYVPVGTVAANVTTFTDHGLAASTTYYYKIRAIGSNGESAFTGRVNAKTLQKPATPDVPPTLSGEAAPSGSVALSWTDESDNETGYKVYKSQNGTDFTLLATLPANSNAYADADVTGFATYYYYVVGTNAAGNGEQSNTLRIRAGNNPPVISNLSNIFVRGGAEANEPFNVTDDAGDQVTVTINDKPSFVTLSSNGSGNYNIKVTPAIENIGTYTVTVTATDSYKKSSSQSLTITVGDQKTKSVYVNFAADASKNALSPWNNWAGKRNAGDVLSALKDETNATTGISITMVDGWSTVTTLGHITGDNSGVFPDAVLQSGLYDSAADEKRIRISGLNTGKLYNIVLVGSQNEGYSAETQFSYGDVPQTSILNSRYNTNKTANLNTISPNASGEIVISMKKTKTGERMMLNGITIEEYDPSVSLLGPNNIYAEPLDRTSSQITWSDRTANEAAVNGYELIRAADSLFSKNVKSILLPANTTSYKDSQLSPDTKYWYRVRAKSTLSASDYSKRVSIITPATIVSVNMNFNYGDAPAPWNNADQNPMGNFTMTNLKDQSNAATSIDMRIEQTFNGENFGGRVTGDNSGVVPDAVLESCYWLDNQQLGQIKLTGLNHAKRYRIGFIGSIGPPIWLLHLNYTATYTVNDKTVYLNSWMNTSKIVYLNNLSPDDDGSLMLNISSTPEAGYTFTSGFVLQEYTYKDDPDSLPGNPIDTIPNIPIDTIPDVPPVDTIPDNPIDTIPGGGDNPIDTIPGGGDNPIDTIPGGGDNPIDTIPGGGDNPIDTIPGGGDNPIDTIPGGGNNPPDSIPEIPPPTDTTANPDQNNNFIAYPNPFTNVVRLQFYNKQATDKISIEIRDTYGRLIYRENFGTRSPGNTVLEINATSANLRTGIYIASLRINDKLTRSVKMVKMKY
jgi:hypothetical protein